MPRLTLLALLLTTSLAYADTKPKYGPMATTLSNSHEYVQKNKAPDYWAMNSYYTAQKWGGSCSLASVTMVINAARAHQKLTSDDALATEPKVLEKVKDPVVNGKSWAVAVGAEGIIPSGVNLDQLGELARKGLEAYGLKVKRVEVVHADKIDAATKAKLHKALIENEKSDNDFIIANFNQQVYTGDAEVGHIAPVAAYDAAKKRVLIMDPDREWYEPYWISEETFLVGMATQDSSKKQNRGYVWIEIDR